jgi:hypothetical protein
LTTNKFLLDKKSHLANIVRQWSRLTSIEKIDILQAAAQSYPKGHKQRKHIEEQIKEIEGL